MRTGSLSVHTLKKRSATEAFLHNSFFFSLSLVDGEFYQDIGFQTVCWFVCQWTIRMTERCLFWHSDTLTMCLSISSSDHWSLWAVPRAPGGRSVEVWVRRACWAHYRPLLMDTLKGSPDRCGFIKSSAHSDGCCYLCMFVSIRLLPPHFLTQGICPSISPHEGSLPCTLCCTGIIVISILKTHCFTCSLASFYISAALSSKIYDRWFPHPSLNLMV